MSVQIAASIAKHFGITVSVEDAPKIILAIQNAYATGKSDEREECASICENDWTNIAERLYGLECAAAIRARSAA